MRPRAMLKRVRTLFNKDVRYSEQGQPPQYELTPDFKLVKIKKGVPRRLDPECGRAKYKKAKKLHKQIMISPMETY